MPEEELATSIDHVAEVLAKLKQEVRQQYDQESASRPPPGEWATAMDRSYPLDAVHSAARVNPHLPIAWPTWPQGLWPKIVAVMQKVVRRLLRWYMNPIVEQQNRYNAAVAQALDVLWSEVVQLRVKVLEERVQRETGDE